jgi:GNAT superfamily N-acetyltransferase
MTVDIVSLASRPDLEDAADVLTDLWPRFMLHDVVADLYFARQQEHAAHIFVALEGERVVGRAYSVPFAMGRHPQRAALPPDGWDGIVRWAWLDHLAGRRPTHVSALEIMVAPSHRGTGLALQLLEALKGAARRIGAHELVAPVRPSRKHEEPHTPMSSYAGRTRDDGLPADPWLRLHVRAGGRIHGVCPTAMTITGTLTQWRTWTGLPFDRSGTVVVPGALAPVHIDVDQDHAVYVEANVWVVHPL